jgi:adenine-specific DNA-methyltransferase
LLSKGYAKLGDYNKKRDQWAFLYLSKAQIKRIEAGEIEIAGTAEDGSVVLGPAPVAETKVSPKTVWNRPSHRAGEYGTGTNSKLLPGRPFPYPKSLYAVEDTLRIAVGDNQNALVLDFFAGSGTTAHAVMRLNRQDGGYRRSISVTNNEVAAPELSALRKEGLRPGDSEWEQWGICEYITKPRIKAAVTGMTSEGMPIKGDYKFIDEFPMANGLEENVEFFTLTYEAPLRVASNREFLKIAPLLWMRAGSRGRRIEEISKGWDVAESYGVLVNLDCAEDFIEAIGSGEGIAIAYIVTDEERLFESIAQELPSQVEPVRLYEAYLRNFEIESGRGSL